MKDKEVAQLLARVASGNLSPAAAVDQLRSGPFRQLADAFAHSDVHRHLRLGLIEAIYGEGKTVEDLIRLGESLVDQGPPVLFTRLDQAKLRRLMAVFPGARANPNAGTLILNATTERPSDTPFVAVIAAGTSDAAVAEEATESLVAMDVPCRQAVDVGVAGLHRLNRHLNTLTEASVVIVIAGMDGALPSVVGGLVRCPVVAVPTSVGYGTGMRGLAALLTMLNSCAPGITVVNIDGGYPAAAAAARMIQIQASAAEASVPAICGTEPLDS